DPRRTRRDTKEGKKGEFLLPFFVSLRVLRGSSYFNFRSCSVTGTGRPSLGIGSSSVHSTAWDTSRRYSISRQFSWKCSPLKPNERPPPGRSHAQPTVSLLPSISTCTIGVRPSALVNF